jgi:long-chain acyl-CoA synthetase
MLTSEEVRYVVDDSGARLLFTTAAMLPNLQGYLGNGLTAEQVIVCEGEATGFMSLAALGAGDGVLLQPLALEPHAPAAILYTSGTTGQQKGATLSHGNVVANVTQTQYCLRIMRDDRVLLFLPLFHCFGQNFIMNTGLTAGATLILHRRFESDDVLDSIERNGVTMLFAVPAVFITLLNADVSPQRLASVRYCFSAAAPLPLEVAARWTALYGHAIHEGYGLTESSPFATYNHLWALRPGSVGTPPPLVDVRVLAEHDEGDQSLAPGMWGEICLRGPNVMLGY